MRRDKFPTYEEKFIKFSLSVEKWLLIVILMFILSLTITQILLHVDSFRVWMVEVEKLEGVAS